MIFIYLWRHIGVVFTVAALPHDVPYPIQNQNFEYKSTGRVNITHGFNNYVMKNNICEIF